MRRSVDRRSMLAMMAAGAGTMTGTARASAQAQGQTQGQVPWSKGTEKPTTMLPVEAVDCHHHIYSSRFKRDPNATVQAPDATVADYRLLMARLGITRHVVVQPSAYGVDNSGLVESLAAFGTTARGIAVVDTDVTAQQLRDLDKAGVRGIRFNLANVGKPATSPEMIEPLAKRVADLGWHIQLNLTADQVVAHEDVWSRVPVPVVFDHLGHLPEPQGIADPAFAVITDLMQKGKGWVKLIGLYADTKVGPPTYADSVKVAAAFVAAAPNQVVWGTDWPHPTEKVDNKPDDALLLDLFAGYVPDVALRDRILVDNPVRLYGF